MKKLINSSLAVGLLATAFTSCKDKPVATPAPKQEAPQTHFQKVTSHLDYDGEYFKYSKINNIENAVAKNTATIEKLLLSSPEIPDKEKGQITEAFKVLNSFIKESGVYRIDAHGQSSIKVGDYYHNKSILHSDGSTGTLFDLIGGSAQKLTSQKFLPENTVLALSGKVKIEALWNALHKATQTSTDPQIKSLTQMAIAGSGFMGVDLPALLKEQSGELGLFLTMDETKTITLPIEGGITIPQVDATIFLARKGQSLDTLLFKNLPPNLPSEKLEGFTITSLPAIPTPLKTQGAIATSEDYIFISSNIERLKQSIQTAKSGQGLTATSEFKEAAKDIPDTGNSYAYLSPRIASTAQKLWNVEVRKAAKKNKQIKNADEILPLINDMLPKNFFYYGVNQVTPKGIMGTSNFTLRPDTFGNQSILTSAATTGILAAMVMPALAKSRAKAKQTQSRNNMKQMGINIAAYLADQAAEKSPKLPEFNSSTNGLFDGNLPKTCPFYGLRYRYSGEVVDGVKIEAGAALPPSAFRPDVNLIIIEGALPATDSGAPKYAPLQVWALKGDLSVSLIN